MGWGTPDHDHTDFAGRSDLEYEADERRRLAEELASVTDRISELRDWLREDIDAIWDVLRTLRERVAKLEVRL